MNTNPLSTGQVAKLLGIQRYQIEYAISSGAIPEPAFRFLGKRTFTKIEIDGIAAYFGKDVPADQNDNTKAL